MHEFDDYALGHIFDGLLVRTLRSLFDPHSSPATRRDANSWIFDRQEGPFCFELCCAHVGVDPDDLRELVVSRMVDHGICDAMDRNVMLVADKRGGSYV
jgi:hypothetical protein